MAAEHFLLLFSSDGGYILNILAKEGKIFGCYENFLKLSLIPSGQ